MQVPVASPENSRHSGLEGMLFQNTSTKTTSACVSRDSPLQQSFFSKKVHFIPYLHLDPLTAQAFLPLVPTCVVHASSQSTQNCTGLFGGLFHTDLYAVLPCTTIYCHLVPHLYCMHAAERERCTFVCSQICTLAPHFKSAPLLLLLSSFPCVCFHPPFTAVHHNPKSASLLLLSSTALLIAFFWHTKRNSLSLSLPLSFSWSCHFSSSSCLAMSTCILATFLIRSSCTPVS